jgi:aldehyde dehydrogenase (NAD+)
MKTHANLIGGDWREGDGVVENTNPSNTGEIVGLYARAHVRDVAAAIDAAKVAAPAWAQSGVQARHDVLKTASEELFARAEEIGRLLSREEGKILSEGIAEVRRAAQIFDFFAGEALRLGGETLPSVRAGVDVEISREALGVVGIITPWNYPIAIPAWKIAPALCHGNAVIFKPAELVPGCGWALAEILHRAELPAGVMNFVNGPGAIVGQALLDDPRVDGISFTGSVATGRRVADACARHMRKCQLEMGGKNPLVVVDDADLEIAVDCAIDGAFYSTGQRCTASSRLIVTEGVHSRFVEMVSERMRHLHVDDALREGTHIGPVVNDAQLREDLSYIEIGRQEGASLRFGGEVLTRAHPGHYLQPALFTDTHNAMRINREEIFGPVASVIRVRDYEEALEVANDTEFGLSSGICTSSLKHASHFKRNIKSGVTMVNLPTAGVDYHVAFGGRKGSSFGPREQGSYAREFYTSFKTAYTRPC